MLSHYERNKAIYQDTSESRPKSVLVNDYKYFIKQGQLLKTNDISTRARGYKTFFMLNSAEHEILNAHKHQNIKKLSIFQAQISLECYFSC